MGRTVLIRQGVFEFLKYGVLIREIKQFCLHICGIISNFAAEMKEMQFAVVVLMTLMAAVLVLQLPGKVREDSVTNRSRWLMAAALVLLGAQFAIQYISGLRTKGVTQAVALNLTMFMPCSVLLSMSVLNLQRQGRIRPREWALGGAFYLAAMMILIVGWLAYDTTNLWRAEVAASVVYGGMQLYFTLLISRELNRMREVLADYYDREPDGLVNWMELGIGALLILAITVPFCIFIEGWPLAVYGLLFMVAIAYLWFNFVRYVIGSAAVRVKEAERIADSEVPTASSGKSPTDSHQTERTGKAVAKWLEAGGYLQHDLKSANAAQDMQVPRSHLLAWVKAQGYDSFTQWITGLRIEEAKRLLDEHPDWSIDAVADHCGISRSHFHTVFKKETGHSPAELLLMR